MLVDFIEQGLIKKKPNAEDYTKFKECNCKLIQIEQKDNHFLMYFENNNAFFQLPIYRLPVYGDDDFSSYKVGNYYNIKFKIENAIVENVLKENDE